MKEFELPSFAEPMPRRHVLRLAAAAAAAGSASLLTPRHGREHREEEPLTFSPAQLGTTINLYNLEWNNLPIEEALPPLFSVGDNIRLPLHFDRISKQKGQYDFSETDCIVDKVLYEGKILHLQLGAKTINYPEVHLPSWLVADYPYLNNPGVVLDADDDVQKYIFDYLAASLNHYQPILGQLGSLHIENEAHSQNLDLANYRFITQAFNRQEIALARRYIPETVPIIQNLPFDSYQQAWAMQDRDDVTIIGLNLYNQTGKGKFFPLQHAAYWAAIAGAIAAIHATGKQVYITEYQTGAWLDGQGNPQYPFSHFYFEEGLRHIKKLAPEARIFLWDVEQVLWRKDEKRLAAIQALIRT